MNQIESNYPRNLMSQETSRHLTAMARVAKAGIFSVSLYFIGAILTLVLTLSVRLPKGIIAWWYRLSWALYYSSYLHIILTAIFLGWWIFLAHTVLCDLRDYQPRFTSLTIAVGSVLSVFIGCIPLAHTLELLLIRSKFEDVELMKWSSFLSWSPLTNNFMSPAFIAIVLNFAMRVPGLIPIGWAWGLSICTSFFYSYALVVGCIIVSRVNQNLTRLATEVQEDE